MTINARARDFVLPLLPADILSFGYPEGLSDEDLKGSTLTVYDLKDRGRGEIPMDLNWAMPHSTLYELVLDPGTLEHVANVSNALRVFMQCVALNGHAVQVAPITMFNHGYWSYSPTLLLDIYDANGFIIKHFTAYDLNDNKPINLDLVERRVAFPSEAWLLLVAKRVDNVGWQWPIQGQWR